MKLMTRSSCSGEWAGYSAAALSFQSRLFSFLAYLFSSLRGHAVWFVSPFEDPVEGYVNAESIRARLGIFSDILGTPSKYAARTAQAFTSTDPCVKIQRDQWEEQWQAELAHTHGELAEKI
jgi:hypothetical protein